MHLEHIHWLGHASFRIEDGSLQLYIDPWKLPINAAKADVIFITHAHYDHFSQEDIAAIRKESTAIFAPKDVAYLLGGMVFAVSPEQSYEVGELKIKTVRAYTIGRPFHPKEKNWVGYIITLSHGQKIYHAGDTDFVPEMRSVVCDVALLPCGGTYTMDAKQAVDAAHALKPQALIPMHWGDIVGSQNDADAVQKGYGSATVIKPVER